MALEKKAYMMKVYIGESDKIHGRPLYEEIVFEARKAGLAGVTVYKGTMSFGASHSIHTMKIFALSSDMPMILEMIDSKKNLDDFYPHLKKMLDESQKGGLVTLHPVEVLHYQKGQKYN